jgi:hypothetical protein
MTAKETLYEFELSADKVSSKNAMNLPRAAKVAYINRGVLAFVLSKYDGDNFKNKGFEESRRRTDALQILLVPHKKLEVAKFGNDIFQADLSKVTDYLFLLRRTVYAAKASCKEVVLKDIIETQTDDLNEYLYNNPYKKPSLAWRRCLERTAQNKLEYFTGGEFDITKVVIDYLRYPAKFDVEGYRKFDGSASTDKMIELPEFTHPEIVALAALEFDWDLNNPNAQSKAAKLQLIA